MLDSIKIKDKDLPIIKEAINLLSKKQYKTFTFIFYFTPQATPRPRLSSTSRVFYVSKKLDYSTLFKQFIEGCSDMKNIITTPCEMHIETYFDIPSSMTKIEKALAELKVLHHVSKPDWDNLGKTYSDMVQTHCILEDSLVYHGSVRKYYSIKPRIEITIRYLTQYDCGYNKKKVESWKSYKDSLRIEDKDKII